MPSASCNGIDMEYEITGSGEPLLLVMGLGGQLSEWPPDFIEQLAGNGFQVIRPDNRDSGLSTAFEWEPPSQVKSVLGALAGRPPKAGYHISDMASDLAGLLDALSIDSVHVVGMSMGGMIAQQLTIDHPSRVRSLTSIMSNTGARDTGQPSKKLLAKLSRLPLPTRETAADHMIALFTEFAGPHYDPMEHRKILEPSVERSWRPEGTARQTAAIMASPDRAPRLGSVKVPTLVVHGLVDPLVRPSGGIATAMAIPHSRLVMFPDMGHDLPRPRWDEMIAEIAANAAAS